MEHLFLMFLDHCRPDHEQQHDYHHDTKVKPEAATAVIELLMMDWWAGKRPKHVEL